MDEFVGGVQLSNTKVQVLLFADGHGEEGGHAEEP